MSTLTVVVGLVACALASVQCVPQIGRIVGGEPIQIRDAPYQISMMFDANGDGRFVHVCGATILQSTSVLTAAHCTNGTLPSQWRLRIGVTYVHTGGQITEVRAIKQHPGFHSNYDNDLAIVFPVSQIVPGDGAIHAWLPAQDEVLAVGLMAAVTGWGKTDDGEFSVQLQRVMIPIVNRTRCQEAYHGVAEVTENMLCAGAGAQGACLGDGGGPLVIDNFVFGVTSWGSDCGHPDYPGVWTNVAKYKNWIVNNM